MTASSPVTPTSSSFGGGGAQASSTVELRVITPAGATVSWQQWTDCRITRDLREIAGSFEFTILDAARAAGALPDDTGPGPFLISIRKGLACSIWIDGELALRGWIDELELTWSADELSAKITGRDVCGDLVDSAAAPYGPAEFNGLDLLQVATIICQPFGIAVRAETDIGPPFTRLAARPHEQAMPFIEGAARQRAVLPVSDGVGALVLTRGGHDWAPDGLRVGDNVQALRTKHSDRARFSDVFVKGQSEKAAGGYVGGRAAQSHASAAGTVPATGGAKAREQAGILMTGHATDPEITRWRPSVRLTRSQAGMSSTQQQAEWAVRVARGEGDQDSYTVLGHRAGPPGANGQRPLWRPNQRSQVTDPYTGTDDTMLIAGVSYLTGARGDLTELRVVGLTAYDRIDESARRRPHRDRRGRHKRDTGPSFTGDSTATPFTGP